MKVLLVYDHGEYTSFYLIKDPIAKHLVFLEDANNKFINDDDVNEAMEFLSDAVIEGKEGCYNEDNAGIWVSKEVKTPVEGSIDRVYFSGIMP